MVSDFPTRLSDFHGNKVDSDSIVSDEIKIQTGLKPVSVRTARQISNNPLTKTLLVSFLRPTKRYWSLFGSRAARLLNKTDRLRQCETYWGYHYARNCHKRLVCQRYGKTGHIIDNYTTPEQCINCLGPHVASLRKCPARPRKVHSTFRRLTKEQQQHVRTVGAEAYRQRHLGLPQLDAQQETQQDVRSPQNNDITLYEQSDNHASSPATSEAPSCIMVATAPQVGYKTEKKPEHPNPRPGSPRKRRIVLINRAHNQE
jgi:hypothetical protein